MHDDQDLRAPRGAGLAFVAACLCLLSVSCGVPSETVDVTGDKSALGASLSIDGRGVGVLRESRYRGPAVQARDGIMVFGGESPEDIVLRPNQIVSVSDFMEMPRATHHIQVVSSRGETLMMNIPPGEFVHVNVSFRRRGIRARVEQ